jgi:serine/threonine protein kinase
MSEIDASWPTTSPGARVASAPDKVPVHDALSPGTRLDEFEIVRVLGTGGFGIVYLARDHVLLREVAIKEYMPAALAGRGEAASVSLRSQGFADTFARGLESFLSEARLLASFDHRSLVKVHRFWRGNGTAYMAMQYYAGQTLKDARLHMSAAPDEAWLDAFIEALLGVLDLLHGHGVYHRDVSPDNILLLDDGRPVLLDLGSARRAMADGPQSFTAHLKPQFAPIEQYAEEAGGMRQGPWTDLYALGATLYFVLTGRAPTPSVVRAVRDVLPSLASQSGSTFAHVRPRLLATVDWTLALAPEQRPQSVLCVRRALSGDMVPPPPSPRQLGVAAVADPAPAPPLVEREERAQKAAPARRWFSRLAPTFWSPDAEADGGGKPSLSRRRAGISAAITLAVMGIVALGWGAWSFNRPHDLLAAHANRAAEATRATHIATAAAPPTAIVATTLAPSIEQTPATPEASAAMEPTTAWKHASSAESAEPSPVLPPAANTSQADPVALSVSPAGQQATSFEPGATAEASPVARQQPAAMPPRPASARRSAARDRHRATAPKVQTASAVAKSSHSPNGACGGPGLLSRAWCALNPCKAPHGRANPECMERLRAEASRQQRVERQ